MSHFTVFDVETPNRESRRMSSIGIISVEDGKICGEFQSLVNPETYFDPFNTYLTGIDAAAVKDAPAFPELWTTIEPIMSEGLLVAHNAAFDMSVLKKCLADYGIFWKKYTHYICTVSMGRSLLPGISHRLDDLCDHYGIELDHHQALSDSRACAQILLRYLDDGADVRRFIRTCTFCSF